MEAPTADRQQSAAADDHSAQSEFRRVPGAVIAVLVSRREGRSCFVLCGPLLMHVVGVSGGAVFGAGVGAARVGEEMHQAESEEQQEQQSADCPSSCSCSVAHTLRHLAVAPT
ncbi:hypothetical protein GCM10010280_51030 [Streptomyces pilosus]|uniref:Uncharacterized protein n=1 Tax=Streptomyces pilosus TaxID=28893 RepID=A0A918BXQ3_9ACTN|nr:hypothetical protein GCM10010280_51030 [Streptomyces pilosus]